MILYTGYVANGEDRVTKYYVDDKDALPPDIRDYNTETYPDEDFSITAFLRESFKGEQRGFIYVIQIKDLYYETPQEG